MKLFSWSTVLALAALASHAFHASAAVTFCAAAAALIPLSGLLGRATGELASHFGDSVGGLLNASCGNLTEIIVVIIAIKAGRIDLVKASIVGSVVGNLLFVLGLSLFVGGLHERKITFDRELVAPSVNALAFAVVALLAPTIAHRTELGSALEHRTIGVGIILTALYVLLIVFRFTGLREHAASVQGVQEVAGVQWGRGKAAATLVASAIVIGLVSDLLVDHIDAATTAFGFSELFVGLFVVPLVANTAERAVAVQAAWQRRFNLSIGIALDSAAQIALLLTPIAIFSAAVMGVPFTLALPLIALEALGIAIGLVWCIVWDGQSNWWEGAMLLLLNVLFVYLCY